MMQSTDLWERDDLAYSGKVNGAALRIILVEREMRSGLVIIAKIRRQHAAQVTLIEDDDVIETLTTDRADDALDVRILPR